MKLVDSIINNVIKIVMGCSALVLSVVTFMQVITRFIFSSPIAWGQDIIRLSFIYLVFWGGAFCVKEKEHLNIDILLTSISVKARKVVELIVNIVLVLFFVFIVYFGLMFTQSGSSQQAPYLPIPMSIYYMSLPTAGVFMIYYQLKEIFNQIKNFKGNEDVGGEQA